MTQVQKLLLTNTAYLVCYLVAVAIQKDGESLLTTITGNSGIVFVMTYTIILGILNIFKE